MTDVLIIFYSLDTYDTSGLVFSDQFLQFSARLNSKYVYGVGEHIKNSFRHKFDGRTFPMFNHDQTPTVSIALI